MRRHILIVWLLGAIYQWVVINDTYDCVNFNKYTREKEQISYDNGVTWEDTGQTRRGDLLEANSDDCGYNHIIDRYEDDEVLYEMYEPCWYIEDDSRTSRLNVRVWNKSGTYKMRFALYEEGAYNRGWKDIQTQTDDRFTFPFSFSTFYRVHNYYVKISKMVDGDLYRKYNTNYFAFTGSEIRNECG